MRAFAIYVTAGLILGFLLVGACFTWIGKCSMSNE